MANNSGLHFAIPSLVSSDSRVTIGRHTYGDPRLLLWGAEDAVEIGSFCSIAEDVTIFGGGEHRVDWITTYPLRIAFCDAMANLDGHPRNKGPTIIGNDVWIGYRAIVLSGVQIGDGAVIGAGSVVTRDVPPYTVFVGNPAVFSRARFEDQHVEQLLQIKWWDWPLEKIKRATPYLCSSDIDSLYQILQSE
jgi:acetyltransferase-like isoleucine patch superfamily enzyme